MSVNYNLNVGSLSESLSRGPDGIWYGEVKERVSYPEGGNAACYQIEDVSFWFEHRNECIVNLAKCYCGRGTTFFDVGGGNGVVSLALQQSGFQSVLLEPGIVGARNAIERGVGNVVCSTLEGARLFENVVPAVGLFDVIEHIEDDEAFLSAVQRYVTPAGFVFATVPAYDWLWSEEDNQAGHRRRYTLHQLKRLFTGAGLEVQFASYFFRPLPLPIAVMRALPYRLGLAVPELVEEKASKEHVVKGAATSALVKLLFSSEVKNIIKRRSMLFGGSCIIVGQKAEA